MSQMRQFDYVPEEELSKQNSGERKKPTRAYFSEGEASFCIDDIEDGFTGEGKPKTMFKLSVVDSAGKTGKYTVHALKSAAWQFMNIFNAIGTGIYRREGYCDDDVLHKNGKLVFGIDESEKYGVQNKVVKWLPYDENAQPNKLVAVLPKAEVDFDDDIPF